MLVFYIQFLKTLMYFEPTYILYQIYNLWFLILSSWIVYFYRKPKVRFVENTLSSSKSSLLKSADSHVVTNENVSFSHRKQYHFYRMYVMGRSLISTTENFCTRDIFSRRQFCLGLKNFLFFIIFFTITVNPYPRSVFNFYFLQFFIF